MAGIQYSIMMHLLLTNGWILCFVVRSLKVWDAMAKFQSPQLFVSCLEAFAKPFFTWTAALHFWLKGDRTEYLCHCTFFQFSQFSYILVSVSCKFLWPLEEKVLFITVKHFFFFLSALHFFCKEYLMLDVLGSAAYWTEQSDECELWCL